MQAVQLLPKFAALLAVSLFAASCSPAPAEGPGQPAAESGSGHGEDQDQDHAQAATPQDDSAHADASKEKAETTTDATQETTPMSTDTNAESLYQGTVKSLDGKDVDLADYAGKTTLIVNVASRCGYTPQYEGLQTLHEELGGDDFAILAFPSNDFGGQEPGTNEQIREFCDSNYSVTFAMFDKVSTKGEDASPVYQKLAGMTGESPGWNFCKYVVSPDGTKAKFFGSAVKPGSDELRSAIAAMKK